MQVMPLFLENEEWYVEDSEDEEYGYKLTDKAPQEAIDSYNEFYGKTVFLEDEAKEVFKDYVFEK